MIASTHKIDWIGATTMAVQASSARVLAVRTSTWVYVSGALFLGLMAAFGISQQSPGRTATVVTAIIGIAFHLALVPVVANVPAPTWTRILGFTWLAIDIASNVLAIGGGAESTTTAIRLAGHLPGAMWIIAASWGLGGLVRPLGALLGAWLFGYTLVAPIVPDAIFMPAMLLMLVWLPLLGRALARLGA